MRAVHQLCRLNFRLGWENVRTGCISWLMTQGIMPIYTFSTRTSFAIRDEMIVTETIEAQLQPLNCLDFILNRQIQKLVTGIN